MRDHPKMIKQETETWQKFHSDTFIMHSVSICPSFYVMQIDDAKNRRRQRSTMTTMVTKDRRQGRSNKIRDAYYYVFPTLAKSCEYS